MPNASYINKVGFVSELVFWKNQKVELSESDLAMVSNVTYKKMSILSSTKVD